DGMLCLIFFGCTRFVFYFYLTAFFESGSTHDDIDFVFFHQKLDAFAHAFGHPAATLDDRSEIGLATAHLNTIIFGMVEVFKHLCTLKQSLGRDAAPVETN